ncbi:MAG: ATP-binding protein [Nitrospirae bacterium]|nr:ATP-binding protein [Nitrospirota bacterium]
MATIVEIKLPATLGRLAEFMNVVTSSAVSQGFTPDRISEIELATEEALVNIMNYAYEGNSGDLQMIISTDASGNMRIELIDKGVPFDSTAVAEPDLEAELDDRNVGGLGVFFIKQLMDDITYSRQDDMNILRYTAYKERPQL